MFYKKECLDKIENCISYITDSEVSHFKVKSLIFISTFIINLTKY